MTTRVNTPSDLDFFESRVFRPDTPCWNWRAYVGKNGYGKWVRSDRQAAAHRVAYELFVGPIPKGMQVHHLCFNRSCVNPEHLRIVTPKENKELGLTAVSNRAKTHCPKGHPLSGNNLLKVEPRRGRVCKACTREATRLANERRRRKAGVLPRNEFCKNGHRRTPENTYVAPSGYRKCKDCLRAKYLKPDGYFARRRAAGKGVEPLPPGPEPGVLPLDDPA